MGGGGSHSWPPILLIILVLSALELPRFAGHKLGCPAGFNRWKLLRLRSRWGRKTWLWPNGYITCYTDEDGNQKEGVIYPPDAIERLGVRSSLSESSIAPR
jgi:hypothetical protein